MMDLYELARQLRACAGGLSIEDFEDWFDLNSWNVHQQNDQDLTDAVFRVEALHSAYADGRLSDDDFRKELARMAAAIYPFAENRYGAPNPITPESNAAVAINSAA